MSLMTSSSAEADKVLAHFGILGMKWGVRRERGADGRVGTARASSSADYRESRAMKAKGAKALSTAELQTLTKRLQLEKQLKDLSPSEYKKGKEYVKEFTAAGTTLAGLFALTQTPFGKGVINVVKEAVKRDPRRLLGG